MTNRFARYKRVSKKGKLVAYTTRNMEAELLTRMRLLCTIQDPPWTMEYGFNEAVKAGLTVLEGGKDESRRG